MRPALERGCSEMVVGIILAAGTSTRMGRSKALLPCDGGRFVSRLAKAFRAAGLDEVIVVTGPELADIEAALLEDGAVARVIENPHRDAGQLSSLQAGLQVADRPGVEAIVVGLVDTPLVAPATIGALLAAWRRTRAPIVRPAKDGRHGHPVLFGRALFADLRRADPAAGARQVVRARQAEAIDVAIDDPGAFDDIDTPDDYARLIGSASGT
ncbi:MAG: nucleotidyltransferase family protein [Acidobacteriota bacterium]